MALELTRIDYSLVGLSAPRCMKLLPNVGPKATQKVVVGGNDGTLQVFSIKRGDVQIAFKTLPGDQITAVELGGAVGSVHDKIFVSSKNEVRGYTKKGKQFLGFDTNLTETIRSMCVSGSDLLVAGSHVYNHYRDCKDANSYICGDTISDVVALSVEKSHRLTSVLACEDRTLKVLEGPNLTFNLPLPSIPTTLCLLNDDGGDMGDQVVYAMQNGQIGLVQLARTGAKWKWLIDSDKSYDAVQCMHWFDMTRDGVKELIVGREDGTIQIYACPFEPLSENEPLVEKFHYVCNESITSVQGGTVGNASFEEVVATTYTGWFFGLTSELLVKQVSREINSSSMTLKPSTDEKIKLERLKTEIDDIEKKVIREREKYQLSTQEDSGGFSTIPHLNINDKMVLLKDESVFQLTIEAETAIDNVLLQSDVEMKLLDVQKNSAVVSLSECLPNSGSKILATYRCQVNTTKLSILLQCENVSGTLNVYITPHAQPKSTHVRTYPIRQLGLYTRIHDLGEERAFNTLTLKGAFSLAEMHNWISKCLPEIPEKPPITDRGEYFFESAYLSTILQCSYQKGEAEFKSDDVTTISILKDFLTKEGTKKKINLDISFVLNDESIIELIDRIYPKLERELQLQHQHTMLEALKDIETTENDSISLTPECKLILEKQQEIYNEIGKSNNRVERLQKFFISLLTEWSRYKSFSSKTKLTHLKDNFNKLTKSDLLDMFELNTLKSLDN